MPATTNTSLVLHDTSDHNKPQHQGEDEHGDLLPVVSDNLLDEMSGACIKHAQVHAR